MAAEVDMMDIEVDLGQTSKEDQTEFSIISKDVSVDAVNSNVKAQKSVMNGEEADSPGEGGALPSTTPAQSTTEPTVLKREEDSLKAISSGGSSDQNDTCIVAEGRSDAEKRQGRTSPSLTEEKGLVPQQEADDFEFDIPLPSKVQQEEDDGEFDFDLPGSSKTPNKSVETCKQESDAVRPGTANVEAVQLNFDITEQENTQERKPSQQGQHIENKTEDEEFDFELPSAESARAVQILSETRGSPPKQSTVVQQKQREVNHKVGQEDKPAACEVGEPVTNDPGKSEALTAAEAEWDAVQTITPGVQLPEGLKAGDGAIPTSSPVSFKEALDHCRTADLDQYKNQVKTHIPRRGFAAFKHLLFGPPRLHRTLTEDRNLVFYMAACPLDNEEPIHIQMLQTVYKRLTGSKFDCQRFGSHWEQIGFQGNDPATDLRGCGLLGLLQLLHLVTNPQTLNLAREIFRLSQHEVQNFPFSVMGINITRLTLQALREDCLNRQCNRLEDVMAAVNNFYTGLYLHLYQIWKTQHKTIKDSGFVIKDIETMGKKKPQTIFSNLETYLEQKKQGGSSQGGGTQTEEAPLQFTGVEDLPGAKAN